MRPIEINLATRPFRNNTLLWAGFGSAALALVAVSVLNVSFFLGYGSTMRQHEEDLTSKQRRQETLAREERQLSVKLTKLDFRGLSKQSDFANDAIRRRVFSWTELFNRLEEVVPPTVMMLSIRPEIQADGISIVVEGTAKDQEGLLQFEENLIGNPRFARIYPGSERREQRGRDLRFSLRLDYVPDAVPKADTAVVAAKGPEPPAGKPESPGTAAPPQPAAAGTGEAPATGGAVKEKTPETPPASAPPPRPSPEAAAPGPSTPPPPVASQETAPPPAAASPTPVSTTPPATPATAAAQAGTLQQRPAPPPERQLPRSGGPRPLAKPGGMGRLAGRTAPGSPFAPATARETVDEAAIFVNRPLEDVFDYLMKSRNMTFVFSGDFDLRRNVMLDLNGMDEREILGAIRKILDCTVTREGKHAYRLSAKSGGEPLEEPPVEEEPVPDDGGQDAGQDADQGAGQDGQQDSGEDPGQDAGEEKPW